MLIINLIVTDSLINSSEGSTSFICTDNKFKAKDIKYISDFLSQNLRLSMKEYLDNDI